MLTILIPTYERSYFLARKLHNLAEQNCAYKVIVIDSSRPEATDKNRQTAEAASATIPVDYRHVGVEAHFAQKIGIGIDWVETQWTVISFDDDFINLKTAASALDRLSKDTTFASASGLVADFVHAHDRSFPVRRVPIPGKAAVFSEPSALARMERFIVEQRARNPLFNVWRSDVLKRIYKPIGLAPWRKYGEILFDHAATYAGPTLQIDSLFEVRNIDYDKMAYRSHGLPGFRRGIETELADPEFSSMFAAMVQISGEIVSESEHIAEDEARAIVAQNFLRYRTRRRPLIYKPETLCDRFADNAISRLWRRLRNMALLAVNLRSPARIDLISRLFKLHGRAAAMDMLRNDPRLRLNYFALMAKESPDHNFFAGIYRTLAAFPEPETSK